MRADRVRRRGSTVPTIITILTETELSPAVANKTCGGFLLHIPTWPLTALRTSSTSCINSSPKKLDRKGGIFKFGLQNISAVSIWFNSSTFLALRRKDFSDYIWVLLVLLCSGEGDSSVLQGAALTGLWSLAFLSNHCSSAGAIIPLNY